MIPLPLVWETPLRTGNLRDPDGPQVTFASESFIDELAAAAKADPVAFRLKLLSAGTSDDSGFKRARSIACLEAAAKTFGWDTRPSPRPRGTGDILTGRGIAYAFRSQTIAVQIAEVEVNRKTGHVWVKRHGLRARLRAGHQSRGARAARSKAACSTRSAVRCTRRSGSTPKR